MRKGVNTSSLRQCIGKLCCDVGHIDTGGSTHNMNCKANIRTLVLHDMRTEQVRVIKQWVDCTFLSIEGNMSNMSSWYDYYICMISIMIRASRWTVWHSLFGWAQVKMKRSKVSLIYSFFPMAFPIIVSIWENNFILSIFLDIYHCGVSHTV